MYLQGVRRDSLKLPAAVSCVAATCAARVEPPTCTLFCAFVLAHQGGRGAPASMRLYSSYVGRVGGASERAHGDVRSQVGEPETAQRLRVHRCTPSVHS